MGPGLGNMLFPWARLVVASQNSSLMPIAPTWPQLKFGSILRNETDKRLYFGLFRAMPDEIVGLAKWKALTRLPHVAEIPVQEAVRQWGGRDAVLVYEGMEGQFEPILREHVLVGRRLLEITRTEHKSGLSYDFRGSISVHVRLGDFIDSIRQPMSWYIDAVEKVRFALGRCVPVYVFSDGTDEELSSLLSLPDVRRVSFGSSVADLIALSRAEVLIASASTFSMWASYLGRMPVIWHEGRNQQTLYYEEHKENTEIEFAEGGVLPADFTAAVADRLQH